MKVLEWTYDQLVEEVQRRYAKGAFHAGALYREIFKHRQNRLSQIDEFAKSPQLADKLENDLQFSYGRVVRQKRDAGVIKFITRLADRLEIESVILPMFNRTTLCLSTQVGCRMGCRFCKTARLGFRRNLTVEEIVGQVYTAYKDFGAKIRNVVFMGMGEPFDNFENVIQSIRVLSDQRGFNIAKRHITVSTVGHVDGLAKISNLGWPDLNLAISLNAPNDRIRSELMPINRTIPMEALKQALTAFPLPKKKAFFIEYVLIKGMNDQAVHAHELALWLKPLKVKLNLIPYNEKGREESSTTFRSPSDRDLHRFRDYLIEERIFVRLRSSLGRSIMAGCGQLGKNPADTC